MNPYVKLIAAVALVVAGYGLARFMGDPAVDALVPTLRIPALASQSDASTGVSMPSSGARLIPEFDAATANERFGARLPADAPPLLPNVDAIPPSASPERPKSDIRILTPTEPAAAVTPTFQTNIVPRAKLRNEAPRSVVMESPPQFAEIPSTTGAPDPAPQSTNPRATIRASYLAPIEPPADFLPITPPPWPAADAVEQQRTHVVIDGDSLARLAGRYLGDPRRSDEIYQLNRGALADPELLPIGAELAIPARNGTRAADPTPPQSLAPRSVASHVAPGMVPVRPIPTAAEPMPRAQLLRPLPAQ